EAVWLRASMSCLSAAVAPLQVPLEMRRVERRAGGAFDQLRRRPARTLRPYPLAPPLVDGVEAALRKLLLDAGMLARDRRPLLRGNDRAERVGRKVAEGTGRPVNVLHRPVRRRVDGGKAEIGLHLGIP